jgi:hypothetical protein
MAVPDTEHYHQALALGDTLARRPHLHWGSRAKATTAMRSLIPPLAGWTLEHAVVAFAREP